MNQPKNLNVLLWGYHYDDNIKAIEELEEEKFISIKLWFGNHPKFNNNLAKLVHNPYTIINEDRLLLLPLDYDELLRPYFEIFLEGYSRISYYKGQSSHELWHLFYLYARYFYTLIKNNSIEALLFQNLPHHGVDAILYGIAKVMNTRTILTTQSLVSNRFWYIEDIEDFGLFKNIEIQNPIELKIEQSFEKNLFYMKNVKKKKTLCIGSLINDFRRIFVMRRKYKPIRVSGIWNKYTECNIYKKMSNKVYSKNIDFKKKYIYFPLQLQPELTTSILGSKYADQLLALEHLAKLIPENWSIYAKENPKQTARQRDVFFYQRLLKIPKVHYLPLEYNSHKLIQESQFVSVVTGTAGWEAISGGKNVLVFGKEWYKTLPGVFTYTQKINFNDIVHYKIEHNLLEKEYSKLIGKTYEGLVDPAYKPIYSKYTDEKNIQHIKSFLKSIL
jgi:hypothetical protein